MKKIFMAIVLATILLLAACNNDEEKNDLQEQEEQEIGFSLSGDSIEEAQNVPEAEKKEVLNAFDMYITTFNDKDLDGYMDMIAEEPGSYNKEDERDYTASVFKEYDLKRVPSDITIVKYDDEEAQVFSKLGYTLKQLSTGLETKEDARQVTLFVKEDGKWKVKSVHSIGENPLQK